MFFFQRNGSSVLFALPACWRRWWRLWFSWSSAAFPRAQSIISPFPNPPDPASRWHLQGVREEDAGQVEALITAELTRLGQEGFSASAIEAAVNTIEFSLRENNTGRFPRGLSLMLRAMASWVYDRDPFQPMRWQEDLERFKARLAAGEDVFGEFHSGVETRVVSDAVEWRQWRQGMQ